MVRSRVLVGVLLAVSLLLVPSTAAAQAQDPESVLRALTSAANAHNADALLALFADNAVLVGPGEDMQPVTRRGKAEIRAFFAEPPGSVENPTTRVEVSAVQVSGDRAMGSFRLFANDITALGVPFFQGSLAVVVQGGKITSMTITAAPPPGQPAPARPAGAPAQVPSALPRTGELPLLPGALAGFGLLALGLLTRRLRA